MYAHCLAVAQGCTVFCSKIGLPSLGWLIGALHDMGKATAVFQDYLLEGKEELRGKINHSSCGARYLLTRFGGNDENAEYGTAYQTARLAALAICGHHSGLPDVLTPDGEDGFGKRIFPQKDIFYEEAVACFFSEEVGFAENQVDEKFEQARQEVERLVDRVLHIYPRGLLKEDKAQVARFFFMHLVERFLFSALLDADRFDTYLFTIGEKEAFEEEVKCWPLLMNNLQDYVSHFPKEGELNRVRSRIAESCFQFAGCGPGVYLLPVPTGGGKTVSSLLFALHAAALQQMRHVYYVAPYKVILEQTADTARKALGKDDVILEHHSDVIPDEPIREDGDAEAGTYSLLTQRWSSPVILTTMVQFLYTLFEGRSACARRFHALAGSVIILDEVQSIPVKFISIFNLAVNFLSSVCGCIVVLCTATQPELTSVPIPIRLGERAQMVPQELMLSACFDRVEVHNWIAHHPYSPDELALLAKSRLAEGSVLMICNTRATALAAYWAVLNSAENEKVPVYFLSTDLCPAHRSGIIEEIRCRRQGEPFICISTQLIEAGVDLSFQTVVRVLAGLDSIIQAAGRCNRNGGIKKGWLIALRCTGENLDRLPDIRRGQEATQWVVHRLKQRIETGGDNILFSPESIRLYYEKTYHDCQQELDYMLSKKDCPALSADCTLVDLLSLNRTGRKAAKDKNNPVPPPPLCQAYHTAGEVVEVIGSEGQAILVPYGKGAEIISDLEEAYRQNDYKGLNRLLREAQRYTVSIFPHIKAALEERGGLRAIGDTGVLALHERFYSLKVGVTLEPQPMDEMII